MVTGGSYRLHDQPVGVKAYGARQGIPPQTSITAPFAWRNSDFCVRALGWLRGSSWGSWPPGGGVFVVGGGQVQSAAAGGFGQLAGVLQPWSQTTRADPSNGKFGMAGMPKNGVTSVDRPSVRRAGRCSRRSSAPPPRSGRSPPDG